LPLPEKFVYFARAERGSFVFYGRCGMSEPEDALARRAKEGDRPAFEELVRRTSRLVFARVYLESGDSHRAEDLTQETFLQAFRSLHQLKDAGGFRSWLLRIAQNIAIDDARRGRALKRVEKPLLPAQHTAEPDESLQTAEARERVLAVLRSLPAEYALPLTLRYISGADYETIQAQLGLSNGSLRGVLHRGLKLMRERMESVGEI
jgi:RNA polymerase sigma-70 factor (ECF subfamily)